MIFGSWPSARRIYLITEAGSWHLLGDAFCGSRLQTRPLWLRLSSSRGHLEGRRLWHLNFMKTRSKVNSSIVLKIYWRKDKIIFDILLKVFEKKTHKLIHLTSTIQRFSRCLKNLAHRKMNPCKMELRRSSTTPKNQELLRPHEDSQDCRTFIVPLPVDLSVAHSIFRLLFGWFVLSLLVETEKHLNMWKSQVWINVIHRLRLPPMPYELWSAQGHEDLAFLKSFLWGGDKWNIKNGWFVKLMKSSMS